MFGRDAHVYDYQWHHVYLHILNLLFVLYYHHVYERGRSSENMIPSPVFNHKKLSSYFCTVLLSVFKTKNHKKTLFSLFPLVLLILRAIGAWKPPKLVGDAKLFVHGCRLFEEQGKGTNLRLPQEFDNYLESPLWEKFSCCITLCLESQRVTFWRIELPPSPYTHIHRNHIWSGTSHR
jgi:hypothetical protein